MAEMEILHPQYFHIASIAEANNCVDEGWVGELYAEYRDLIHGVALRVVRNADDAEDVVQNVFLRMIRNEVRPEAGRSAAAYFRRAATNAAIDLVRKRTQMGERELADTHPAPGGSPVGALHVRQVLGKLPAKSAALLEMHSRGYMYEELAERFGLELGTVKSRLHRIRAGLWKELQVA